MWTFPMHQEQREIAAVQLGKEHLKKKIFSFRFQFLPFLPSLLLYYCVSKKASSFYVLLFNLQADSSELWIWMEKGEHPPKCFLETSICSNTRCSCLFFFFFPSWLFTCRFFFPTSKSAFYLRTSRFLCLHCKTRIECMMIVQSNLKYCE